MQKKLVILITPTSFISLTLYASGKKNKNYGNIINNNTMIILSRQVIAQNNT